MSRGIILTAACFAAGTGVMAQTVLLNFESESAGIKPNGYSPAGHPDVKFYDTVGADLTVNKYTGKGIGNRTLAVFFDEDGSKLRIDFAKPMSALSFYFGNDDTTTGRLASSDRAWLEIWNGTTMIARLSMALNLDKAANQVFSYSGSPFTQAYFWYGTSTGSPFTVGAFGYTGMIEMVDDISYTYAVIPEPAGTLAVGGLLSLGAVALRRWRNQA
jgi:hypothetical protein